MGTAESTESRCWTAAWQNAALFRVALCLKVRRDLEECLRRVGAQNTSRVLGFWLKCIGVHHVVPLDTSLHDARDFWVDSERRGHALCGFVDRCVLELGVIDRNLAEAVVAHTALRPLVRSVTTMISIPPHSRQHRAATLLHIPHFTSRPAATSAVSVDRRRARRTRSRERGRRWERTSRPVVEAAERWGAVGERSGAQSGCADWSGCEGRRRKAEETVEARREPRLETVETLGGAVSTPNDLYGCVARDASSTAVEPMSCRESVDARTARGCWMRTASLSSCSPLSDVGEHFCCRCGCAELGECSLALTLSRCLARCWPGGRTKVPNVHVPPRGRMCTACVASRVTLSTALL